MKNCFIYIITRIIFLNYYNLELLKKYFYYILIFYQLKNSNKITKMKKMKKEIEK